jgi:ribosomal protein L34
VYLPRFPFLTCVSLRYYSSSLRDTFYAGKVNTKKPKGAGIRVFEYASKSEIEQCRIQLEAIFWLCVDADAVVVANGMSLEDAAKRKQGIIRLCEDGQLLDYDRLIKSRILNEQRRTICPLCLEELSSQGFFSRMEQAEGREVLDLTVTQLNLFHIEELRMGAFNHRPYNLGWGHHHCNVVGKDSGIAETLEWMRKVVDRNATI